MLADGRRHHAQRTVHGAVQPLCRRAGARRWPGGRVIPPAGTGPTLEIPPRPPLIRPAELLAIATIVGVDQLTKFLVRSTIPLYTKRTVIPRLLDFTHVQNTGAAFGVLNAADFPYKSAVMIGIAALA